MDERRSTQRERERLRYRARVDNMTEEQRSAQRERRRRLYRERMDNMTAEQRSLHRERRKVYAQQRRQTTQRSRYRIRMDSMSEEQRAQERERRRAYYIQRREQIRGNTTAHQQQGVRRRRSTVHNCARDCINTQVVSRLQLANSVTCPHCGAKLFPYETRQICCLNGDVALPLLRCPPELMHLLTVQSETGLHFRKNIRNYNHVFSFTSMGVHLDESLANARDGVYTYRAQGSIYHKIGSLLPEHGDRPRYLQMFIYDTDHEIENRLAENDSLSRDILGILSEMLDICNPYVHVLRQISQCTNLHNIKLQIKERSSNRYQYSLPTSSQVAAILVGGLHPDDMNERDIIVQSRSGGLINVPDTAGYYDPLQYPLLHPYGTSGWDLSTFNEDEERTSCRTFYAYHLQIRENHFCLLLHAGRLLQQYVVDNYVKISTQKLRYIRDHQPTIRAELYQSLVDSVNAGQIQPGEVGRRIILPVSYNGSPRDMDQRYHDAMAIVQFFGKPDLFITMTCNPNWDEITTNMFPTQTAPDRGDLTCRIFHSKLEELKKDLFQKGVQGKVIAYVYVIEFQKRGLPHAHILLILDEADKLHSPDDYDKVIRAEIPLQHMEPDLYTIVTKHMIHGPCGRINPGCVCMKNGKCKKNYPKQFSSETRQGTDSYPIYRGRVVEQQVVLNNGTPIDNRWVVPYNPWLLKKYDCHINVEVCSNIKCVKYLYKYVYKGSDRVSMQISSGSNLQHDEIKQFIDARWICPQQSFWHIFKFRMNQRYPSVRLPQVHLPNRHQVTFYEWQDLSEIITEEISSRTMLTEFFATNKVHRAARNYLYREFPQHYKWNNSTRHWERRTYRSRTIGRIYAVSPTDGERYFLRVLLNHIRGPTSFDDLLTVNSVRYTSFKNAAQQHGLLERDGALRETLFEASGTHMPSSLRNLFATLLVYCEPVAVRELWDEFYEFMVEDYPSSSTSTDTTNRLLNGLNSSLRQYEKSTADFDLPAITNDDNNSQDLINILIEELSIPVPPGDLASIDKLNDDQRYASNRIMECVQYGESVVFFIDGPGGTGKTYLYRAILAHVRNATRIAIATATSGIASIMMPGGRTAHSTFKLPLDPKDTSTCQISKQSNLAQLLRQTSIIIWDEATMTDRRAFEALDRTMQDIMDDHAPFGGKLFVLGGDFRQVLPVVVHGSKMETIDACITRSRLWRYVEVIHLRENIRAKADPSFSEFLLRIGNETEPHILEDMIRVPDDIAIPWESEASLDVFLNIVFPEIQYNAYNKAYIIERAVLTPTNEIVDVLNDKVIRIFPGDEMEYYSFDIVERETRNLYQQEFLNSLSPGGLPPHKLTLKLGAPIILLRNLDPKNGLCNGTRLLCRAFYNNVIDAEIVTGNLSGSRVFIPRIPLKPPENLRLPFVLTRKQFPIRLSFALTINKSQGQTLPYVGVYLPQPIFIHGQLYVAL